VPDIPGKARGVATSCFWLFRAVPGIRAFRAFVCIRASGQKLPSGHPGKNCHPGTLSNLVATLPGLRACPGFRALRLSGLPGPLAPPGYRAAVATGLHLSVRDFCVFRAAGPWCSPGIQLPSGFLCCPGCFLIRIDCLQAGGNQISLMTVGLQIHIHGSQPGCMQHPGDGPPRLP
jgi:hypothetical protein